MISALQGKYVSITPPAAIKDNDSYTTSEIDTLGWDYLEIIVYLGATDVDMTALKVTESDTSGSSHTDITGLVTSGTTGDERLPQEEDGNKFWVFNIDLRGRKRYIDLVATAGNGTNGTYLAALARLSRGNVAPLTAAQQGLAGRLDV